MVNDQANGGAAARAWRLGKLGLTLTGSYLGYQLQNLLLDPANRRARQTRFQQRASRRTRQELESLKGPMMKIGQLLGMQSHVLPPEAVEELAALQTRAPAMHPTLARAQFKASLGREPEEIFREFDPVPVAAASLGQVHRGVTRDGATVAIKIQYPAMRTAIENDFKLFRSASSPIQWSGHFPKSLLDEMQERVTQETDYRNEAGNLEWFRERLKCIPYVSVPKVHREFSSERVLTMSFTEGVTLHQWFANELSQKRRDRMGTRLLELFNYQVHWLRGFHADPHPGNYLINTEDQIGLVDFGCAKFYDRATVKLVRCFLERAWKRGEFERLVELAWHPSGPAQTRRAREVMEAMIGLAELIYPDPEKGGTVVDFGGRKVLEQMPDVWQLALKNRLSYPQFAFHCRVELGLYNLLHRLRARVDTAAIVKRLEGLAGPVPACS